ncbi:nucleoporin [Clostridium sp.]|uniref:nucleoporin FG repeat-containing protein n=1 Tax=Clostridium sp. TaxID=1506 RepID=UPI00283E7DAF|nr:nucleoporin [Clostridium sp.]MDR3597171.1 nucleoporin [Clostridium sp.]
MSTTQKDPVIEMLLQYMQQNPESLVGELLTYANPTGSTLNTDAGLNALRQRVDAMNRSGGEFDPEGTELPISSVGIQVRVRHTISEYLKHMEVANLMQRWILVSSAKGIEWPPKLTGISNANAPVIKLGTVKSVKKTLKDALVKELPTIIDLMYQAKYKSSGTFSYSLAEVKLYTVKPNYLRVALAWIRRTLQLDNVSAESPILVSQVNRETRNTLHWEDWYAYSRTKARDGHKYPPYYTKLVSVVCARVGKLLYTTPTDKDYDAVGMRNAEDFVRSIGFTAVVKDNKKKSYQKKLSEFFLQKCIAVHQANATVIDRPEVYKSNVIAALNEVIGSIVRVVDGLGIDRTLVFLDCLLDNKPFYTRSDFDLVQQYLGEAMTGVANERVMNSIGKFISTTSLISDPRARKFLDPEIERVIATEADLKKIKVVQGQLEPNIVFSRGALSMMTAENNATFAPLFDPKNQGATGYLQKGVMSMIAALKTDSEHRTALPNGASEADIKHLANMLGEMANIYYELHTVDFEARKKEKAKAESQMKLAAKHGVPSAMTASPSQFGAYVPNVASPSQFNGQSMFGAVPQVPLFGAQSPPMIPANHAFVESQVQAPAHGYSNDHAPAQHHHHASHVHETAPVVAAPASLFGTSNTSSMFGRASGASSPVSSPFGAPVVAAPASLFGGAPVLSQSGRNSPVSQSGRNSPSQQSLFGAPAPSLFGGPASPGMSNQNSVFGGNTSPFRG